MRAGGVDFAENFLQIMQCWTEPEATEPVPEQCVFGATDGVFGGRNGTLFANGGFSDDRVIARGDFETFDGEQGVFDEATNWLWMPFRSVTGATVGVHVDTDFSPSVESGDFWLNSFFDAITTNEIPGGRTRPDGSGEELFEVTTGQESSGLGCGQAVLGEGDDREIPQCWLVIVPRGSAVVENEGTIEGQVWEGNAGVMTSPLAAAPWANRIAIPLEFNPVDTPCDLNDDQRRIVGSELLLRSVASWQPALCGTPGLPPYAYTRVSDDSARLQVVSRAAGAPGMAVTSLPLPENTVSEANPVVYAPLSLSSIVIGFNVERTPDVETAGPDAEALRGVRIAELNLTPRLVAKLLTQSYQSQVNITSVTPQLEGYEWAEENPRHLDEDPDFLRFNPEFELLRPQSTKNFGGLLLAAGTSDAAHQLWDWILADPEAKAWLDGKPDEFGMVVNPVYATTAEVNSAGIAFGEPIPESFPKSDPYCYQAEPQGPAGRVVPPALCGTDWMPYAASFRDAAQRTRAANDGARTTRDPEAISSDRVWRANGPQRLGSRAMLALVDSPTAIQYGLQTASLSRAGDNGDDRIFIEPDDAGMAAGVEAMEPGNEPNVLLPDPLAESDDAYPLTVLTYGAVTPRSLDEQAREEYAAFVEYAVGEGQEPGLEIGQLPPGYSELPGDLQTQALEAADAIRSGLPAPAPTTTTTTSTTTPPPTTAPTTAPPVSNNATGATPRSTPTTAVTTPPTTPTTAVAVAPPVIRSTTTTMALPAGVTPASAVGGARYALPVLGGLALLSLLGVLEITKRPRRGSALVGASGAAVVLALCLAVGPSRPAAAQAVDQGAVSLVDDNGDAVNGGGSATTFNVRFGGAAECPGDSANDDYRIYSFMVPSALAADEVVYDGLGPSPRSLESYEDFRMPLFDVQTNEYTAGLTVEHENPGEPGLIAGLPTFSFGVFGPGEMPLGAYRIGISCTLHNEVERFWDTEIVVTEDAGDPSGFEWRVVGAPPADDSSAGSSLGIVLVIGGAAAIAIAVLVIRRRSLAPARPPREFP